MLTVEKGAVRHGMRQERGRKRNGVCVWQERKDKSRVREGDEKELTKDRKAKDVLSSE